MQAPIRLHQFLLFLLFLLNVAGFFFFERSLLLCISLLIIMIWLWSVTFLHKRYEPLLLVTLFIFFNNLYNLYLAISLPLWSVGIIASLISSGFYLWSIKFDLIPRHQNSWLFSFIIALSILEITFIISLWPTFPSTRAIVAMIAYFLLSRFSSHYLQKQFNSILIISYLSFAIIALLILLLSSSWYYAL